MTLTLSIAELLEQHDHANNGKDEQDCMNWILLNIQHLIMLLPAWASRATSTGLWVFSSAAFMATGAVTDTAKPVLVVPIVAGASSKTDEECGNGDQASHEIEYTAEFSKLQTGMRIR